MINHIGFTYIPILYNVYYPRWNNWLMIFPWYWITIDIATTYSTCLYIYRERENHICIHNMVISTYSTWYWIAIYIYIFIHIYIYLYIYIYITILYHIPIWLSHVFPPWFPMIFSYDIPMACSIKNRVQWIFTKFICLEDHGWTMLITLW